MEGPVEVELEDGTTVSSDRFRVALCTCRRSRRYPWCDTSHRARTTTDSGRRREDTGPSEDTRPYEDTRSIGDTRPAEDTRPSSQDARP
jgi:CDGSH-type Zn-finger protein